ncbi:MAG: hypothetical protein ACRDJW_17200 [Thermomicrobiales bacterium]
MADKCGPDIVVLSTRRMASIVERRESLARRLDDGYDRIEQAAAAGTDVAAWEDFWIDLLREYEAVCDELAAA